MKVSKLIPIKGKSLTIIQVNEMEHRKFEIQKLKRIFRRNTNFLRQSFYFISFRASEMINCIALFFH